MALVLQLATLLLATTAFATPSPQCTPNLTPKIDPGFVNYELSYVYLAAGLQTFACNASGVYEPSSFYFQLYDASCLNDTSLDIVTAEVGDYVAANQDVSSSDLNAYLKQTFSLDNFGQILTTEDNLNVIELYITGDNSDEGDQKPLYLDITSKGDEWEELTSTDGGSVQVLLIEANSPGPTSSCGIGSPDLDFRAAVQLFVYTTRDDN